MGGLQMPCIRNIKTIEKMGEIMDSYRIIGWCDKEGTRESVYFTQDTETPVGDFMPYNMNLLYDEVVYIDLPTLFPIESELKRL